MTKKSLAETIYEGEFAKAKLEDLLDDVGLPTENYGHDYYDNSIEFHKIAPDFRLNEAQQKVIFDAGFATCYVNHTDGWETHYNFNSRAPFTQVEGWRVSHPHKRNDGTPEILVEKPVESWPPEWLTGGKYKVVEPK
jgi:hypothetical protein